MYYIIQKDGHRYDFHNIRSIRTEYSQRGDVEILVIAGQFKPRQRFKDVRLRMETIKETNIADVKDRILRFVA